MKKRILLFSLSLAIGSLAVSSYRNGAGSNGYDCTGAESAGTGTLANPTGCSTGGGCHGSAATTTIGVTLELDSAGVATTHYVGGHTYTIKITGTNGTGSSLPNYGFQIAALKGTASAATESDAGAFATTGLPTSTHLVAPSSLTQLTIAEQSSPLSASGTTCTQSFTWTAPAAGTGNISFWGAVNFVNGNGSADAGDKFNTGSLQITEITSASHVSVAEVQHNISINAFPNPIANSFMLHAEGLNDGSYSVHIFDINGKLVADETAEAAGGKFSSRINSSAWAAGLYNVLVSGNGVNQVVTISK